MQVMDLKAIPIEQFPDRLEREESHGSTEGVSPEEDQGRPSVEGWASAVPVKAADGGFTYSARRPLAKTVTDVSVTPGKIRTLSVVRIACSSYVP